MSRLATPWATALGILTVLSACKADDSSAPTPLDGPQAAVGKFAAPPGALVDVAAGGQSARIWPFVSADLATGHDPVNLLFAGRADPRAIRSALLALDGNRAGFGFPPGAPFDCVWSDAIGGLQGGYTEAAGWTGSAIQLQCGGFGPIRFHLRLFGAGVTLGGAHFEAQIPGTTDHQVLSWELAEQLVTADLARTGLLGAAPAPTAVISPAPSFREIPAIIYNGLPDGLKQLAQGPLGTVSTGVPILTDGRATVLVIAGTPARAAGATQQFTVQFGQVIPRPFCGSGSEYLYVTGPVAFEKTVSWQGDELRTRYRATGALSVIPIDPTTGQPTGAPYQAAVSEDQTTVLRNNAASARGLLTQAEIPTAPGFGRLREQIEIGERSRFDRDVVCTPVADE